MKQKRILSCIVLFSACFLHSAILSQDVGAISSGNWNNPGIWTTGSVPNGGNVVYIGSIFPGGSALTATVTLTENHSANTVTLGNGGGTSGTLDLGDFILTANALTLGFDGTGTITRGNGSFQVNNLFLNSGNSLAPTASDVIANNLSLSNSSSMTLPTAQNLTQNVLVQSGSSLTLGGDLTVGNQVNVRNSGSVLDAQGFNITAVDNAAQVLIGWDGVGATLINRGNISAGFLGIGGQNFNLTPSDSVTSFGLMSGSTTMGASVSVSNLSLDNSTATLTNGNNVTANINMVNNSTLTLPAAQNLTQNVELQSGSVLTLGGDLTVGNRVNLRHSGTVLDAQGFNITAVDNAAQVMIGWEGPGATLINRGNITAGFLGVAGQNFDLTPTDTVNIFAMMNGSTTLPSGVTVGTLSLNESTADTAEGSTATHIALITSSVLHVMDNPGQSTGFTLLGETIASLNIDSSSQLLLDIDGLTSDWIFRWANPNGGDHIAEVNNLIALGRIGLNNPGNAEYDVFSADGFTYVGTAVPEPTTYALMGIVGIGGYCWYRRRKYQREKLDVILDGSVETIGMDS